MPKLMRYKSFKELKSVSQNPGNNQPAKSQTAEIEMFLMRLNKQMQLKQQAEKNKKVHEKDTD